MNKSYPLALVIMKIDKHLYILYIHIFYHVSRTFTYGGMRNNYIQVSKKKRKKKMLQFFSTELPLKPHSMTPT